MQPNTSAAVRNHAPAAASQTKQTARTIAPIASPAATTERKYAAGGTQPERGAMRRSAEMPRVRSVTMMPQAHSGTVMQAQETLPASIQLSQKARTALSPPVTPASASAARIPSVCTLPKNRA